MEVFQCDTAGHAMTTEARASFENPKIPLNDVDAWEEVFGEAGQSTSGVRVTTQSALKLSGVFKGVSLIANAVAKLPLPLYMSFDDALAARNPDRKHRAGWLMRKRVNRLTSAFTFRRTLTAHAILTGNGYGYIYRKKDGSIDEIVILQPDRTYPIRVNGRMWYVTAVGGTIDDPQSTLSKLDPDNVIHIKGLGSDGISGYSVIKLASEGFGGALARQEFGNRFFENAATPKFTIEAPNALSDKAYSRLMSLWTKMKAGLRNAHKATILEEGAKANPLTINPDESQLLESKEFDLITCANYLLLPPHKLGAKINTSYASLEQANQECLDDAIEPWLVEWETELDYKLLSTKEFETDQRWFEFTRQAYVRSNLAVRSQHFRTALGGLPWMTRPEVRALEGLDPSVKDEEFVDPLNMGSLADSADGGANGDKQGSGVRGQGSGVRGQRSESEPYLPIVREAIDRMTRRVLTYRERAANRTDYVEKFASDHEPVIRAALDLVQPLILTKRSLADWFIEAARDSNNPLEKFADQLTTDQ